MTGVRHTMNTIFGDSHIDEEAEKLGLNVLGKVPMEPSYAEAADKGEFHKVVNVYIDWSR